MSTFQIILIVVLLFAGMLACLEVGLWLGRRAPQGAGQAFSPLAGAVFALMGLLIAFTFSGAATRFEAKRDLIVSEANAIGTAYLRLDLLPAAAQEPMRERFRRYLDARLEFYGTLGDAEAAGGAMAKANALQQEIWARAIAACAQNCQGPITVFILSSFNDMIDVTTTRAVALQTHPPAIVLVLLGVLPLICSLLAGYDAAGKGRSLIHMLGFALILAITIYIILDYEYPRAGLFIHLDATDKILVNLRQQMNH